MSKPLLILYGTVTGNAEICAENIATAARKHGYEPRVWNVDGYDTNSLANEPLVVFVVSTYGEGDPPDTAVQFWEELQAQDVNALKDVNYAIYALGDTSYSEFCGFGKKLDAELAAKSATCILNRHDSDLDYEAALPGWSNSLFAALKALEAQGTVEGGSMA